MDAPQTVMRACVRVDSTPTVSCMLPDFICPLGSFVPRRQLHTCAPSASASTMKADADDAAAAAAKKARKAAKKEKKLRDKAGKESQIALGEWCIAHDHRAKRTPYICSVSLRGIAAHSVACTSTTRTCSARLACWRNVIKRASSRCSLGCLPGPISFSFPFIGCSTNLPGRCCSAADTCLLLRSVTSPTRWRAVPLHRCAHKRHCLVFHTSEMGHSHDHHDRDTLHVHSPVPWSHPEAAAAAAHEAAGAAAARSKKELKAAKKEKKTAKTDRKRKANNDNNDDDDGDDDDVVEDRPSSKRIRESAPADGAFAHGAAAASAVSGTETQGEASLPQPLSLKKATKKLTKRLNRAPSESEIAEYISKKLAMDRSAAATAYLAAPAAAAAEEASAAREQSDSRGSARRSCGGDGDVGSGGGGGGHRKSGDKAGGGGGGGGGGGSSSHSAKADGAAASSSTAEQKGPLVESVGDPPRKGQIPDGNGGWRWPPTAPRTGNGTILLFYGCVISTTIICKQAAVLL
jgi:uncharacterized membrane protein YgcG